MIESKFNVGTAIINGIAMAEPPAIQFTNSRYASELLDSSINEVKRSGGLKKIMIHADVDFDGVASSYIIYKVIADIVGRNNIAMCINRKRVHGITDDFVDLINKINGADRRIELAIVVDSSTNDIDKITATKSNVLVIDHHELEVPATQMTGATSNGRYVIVNNEIDHIPDMSGAEVVYEWLKASGYDEQLKFYNLYSWVGVSLFSDVIDGDNLRNQWYIERVVKMNMLEDTLSKMYKSVCYGGRGLLDKTAIQFSLVPIINASVRTGHSTEMLEIIKNKPEDLSSLSKYKTEQTNIVEKLCGDAEVSRRALVYTDMVTFNMDDVENGDSYAGLVATKLGDRYRKTCIAWYNTDKGIKGSFRLKGRYTKFDFRLKLNEIQGMSASGHNEAFGFEWTESNDVADVVQACVTIANNEGIDDTKVTIGIGDNASAAYIDDDIRYIIADNEDDMKKIIKTQELQAMAVINSRMSGNKKALIRVPFCKEAVKGPVVNESGRQMKYNVLGLEVLSFNDLFSKYDEGSGYLWLYPELGKYLTVYAEGVRM